MPPDSPPAPDSRENPATNLDFKDEAALGGCMVALPCEFFYTVRFLTKKQSTNAERRVRFASAFGVN